jgi:hypothetical protein
MDLSKFEAQWMRRCVQVQQNQCTIKNDQFTIQIHLVHQFAMKKVSPTMRNHPEPWTSREDQEKN